jgi:hypothetical protein
MRTPAVTEDEIANAAGIGEVHDGVNFMRAACVIAIEKAQMSFEPMLEALRHRATHIMRRLYPIVEYMVSKSTHVRNDAMNRPLQLMIRRIYEKYVEIRIQESLEKCRDDLHGMTRFVTWDVDGKGSSSMLYKAMPTPKKLAEIYTVAVDTRSQKAIEREEAEKQASEAAAAKTVKTAGGNVKGKKAEKDDKKKRKSPQDRIFDDWEEANAIATTTEEVAQDSQPTSSAGAVAPLESKGWEEDALVAEYYDLMQLMEEMLAGRNANRTSTVVTAIVQYIIRTWTEHFARMVAMKFNCFFLMPFMDDFPLFLRTELDKLYDSGVDEMFDIAEARKALMNKRMDLLAECEANTKLQRRFDVINSQLRGKPVAGGDSYGESRGDGSVNDGMGMGMGMGMGIGGSAATGGSNAAARRPRRPRSRRGPPRSSSSSSSSSSPSSQPPSQVSMSSSMSSSPADYTGAGGGADGDSNWEAVVDTAMQDADFMFRGEVSRHGGAL